MRCGSRVEPARTGFWSRLRMPTPGTARASTTGRGRRQPHGDDLRCVEPAAVAHARGHDEYLSLCRGRAAARQAGGRRGRRGVYHGRADDAGRVHGAGVGDTERVAL